MRALRFTGPSLTSDSTEVGDVPCPVPQPGEVAIDVGHAGINFIDVMARRGDPGYATTWPYVPGLEVAGTVRQVGSGVPDLAVGQRVAAFTRGGGLAQVALADARLVVPLPDSVAYPGAAAAPLMMASAMLILTDAAGIRPGDRVLMHSASGGIGGAVARLAAILGAGVRIGTVGSREKLDAARRAGWDVALVRDEFLAKAVREAAGGAVDVIIDPAGTSLVDVDLAVAAPGGRIVLFGNPGGGQPGPLPPLGQLIGANVSLAGFSMSRLTAVVPDRAAAALRRVVDLLAAGELDIAVTEVGSLDEVPRVHQLLAAGRGTGKYVVSLQPAAD